jgi:DNA polymerase III sliding clamp (beta) subunit (PCNA family)
MKFTYNADFINALKKTVEFTAIDAGRPALQTILIDGWSKVVKLVATDGYILSTIVTAIETEKSGSILLNRDDALKIINASKGHSVLGTIENNANRIEVWMPGAKMTFYIPDVEFPKYKKIKPKIVKPHKLGLSTKLVGRVVKGAIDGTFEVVIDTSNPLSALILKSKDYGQEQTIWLMPVHLDR